jgi:hypothetical protein
MSEPRYMENQWHERTTPKNKITHVVLPYGDLIRVEGLFPSQNSMSEFLDYPPQDFLNSGIFQNISEFLDSDSRIPSTRDLGIFKDSRVPQLGCQESMCGESLNVPIFRDSRTMRSGAWNQGISKEFRRESSGFLKDSLLDSLKFFLGIP